MKEGPERTDSQRGFKGNTGVFYARYSHTYIYTNTNHSALTLKILPKALPALPLLMSSKPCRAGLPAL